MRPTRPLVGRGGELAELATAVGLDDPDQARAHAVLVGGDAGIGKTRVVDELTDRACAAGWRVLTGHCLDVGEDEVAWLPVTEVLGRLAADEPDVVGSLLAARPVLARLLPADRRVTATGAAAVDAAGPGELLESLLAALGDLAAEKPLLLVVEDAHWADQSTRSALNMLLGREPERPLRVVVTYRTDDLHRRHPLRPALAGWARLRGVARVPLAPLPESDAADLARDLAGPDVDDRAVRAVVDRADGNAFFVEELVGALDARPGELPLDLADLLLLRLETLDDDTRTVVRTAAVAGRRVGVDLLSQVVDLDPGTLDAALRSAVEQHVLVADGEAFAFRHALLAEAVYDDLMPGERTRLHGRYALALDAGAADGAVAELARHARLSGQHDLALRASIEAGDEATRVGAPGEAGRHYERALEMLGPDGGTTGLAGVDAVELVTRAAGALIEGGLVERAGGLVRDALTHLPDDADPRDRVRLEVALADAALVGDVGLDPYEVAAAARDHLGDLDDDALRARVLGSIARATRLEDHADGIAAAEEARMLAERTGQPQVATDARVSIARLAVAGREPDASRRVLSEVVERARAEGDLTAELRSGYHLATIQMEGGDPDGATDAYLAVVRRAAETGRRWAPYGLDARVLGVVAAHAAGRWDEALRLAGRDDHDAPPVPRALLVGAALLVHAGRGETDHLDDLSLLRAQWGGDPFVALLAAGGGIELLGRAGRVDDAAALLEEVAAVVAPHWGERFAARVRFGALLLGQRAAHVRQQSVEARARWLDAGDALRAGLEPIGREDGVRRLGPEGVAWFARAEAEHARLGWLGGRDHDADDLVRLWTQAVEQHEANGHVYEAARSRARLAGVLAAAGRTPDASREASAARVVAERLGAVPLVRELAGAGVAPARAAGPDAADADEQLTAREHEVLALVADGLTNGEIGKRLFISTKTVSVHVSRILAKLGAAGRTEAAATARRRGLLDG